MKKLFSKRNMLTVLALVLVAVVAISGTYAYLVRSSDTSTNTFTIGDVGTLEINGALNLTGVPGTATTVTEPTITYTAAGDNNQSAYIFAKVTMADGWAYADNTFTYTSGTALFQVAVNTDNWEVANSDSGYVALAYKGTGTSAAPISETTTTEKIFNTVAIPAAVTVTNANATANLTVDAYAIQSTGEGITSAATAWTTAQP